MTNMNQLGFFVVFLACLFCVQGKNHKFKPPLVDPTCGTVYNHTDGKISYHRKSTDVPGKGATCSWIVTFNNTNATGEILLVVEEFHLEPSDTLTIVRNGNDSSPLNVGPFNGTMEPFMILTGAKNITVTLKTTDTERHRNFEMLYYASLEHCAHNLTNIQAGSILTPFYDKNRTALVNCSLQIFVRAKDSFKLNTLLLVPSDVDANVNLIITKTENLDGTYNGANVPLQFTSVEKIAVELKIQPNGVLQQIRFAYQAVTVECSGTVELSYSSSTTSTTISNPKFTMASLGETPALNCRTLVYTKENVAGLSVTVNAHNLTGPLDQVVVVNVTRLHASSRPLLQLISSNEKDWEDDYILTNEKEVSVSLLSPFPSPALNVSVTISLARYGGYFEDSGHIGVSSQKEAAIFLLKVDSQKQIRVNLTSKSPPKKGTLDFYCNFEKGTLPFASLKSLPEGPSSIISPSPLMTVIAKGFDTESFDATFDSIDRGCFLTSTDDGGSYNLFGKCFPICAWTVAAKTGQVGDRKLHFSSLRLNAKDTLRVVRDGKNVMVNMSGPIHHLADLIFNSNESVNVIIQRDCTNNGTNLVANYVTFPDCHRNVTLILGQSFKLSSPGYPDGYPVGTMCKWRFDIPQKTTLHLEFLSLRLGSIKHELTLYQLLPTQDTLLAKFTGANTTLPRDYVLNSNLGVFFAAPDFNSSGLDSSDNFVIKLTVADCGSEMLLTEAGLVETPSGKKPNTTDANSCVWLVGLPEAKGQKRIIRYNITSSNSSSLPGYLKVFEGSSRRDIISPNVTGINLLSRDNYLFVVYFDPNATSAGPTFALQYKAEVCNNTLCGNKICMHDDWKCNGKNDCGDWSDEKFCMGPTPTPPGPAPTPSPSKPVPGVSSGTLAGGILGSLIIGALIGALLPVVIRWYKARASASEYSTLMGSQ